MAMREEENVPMPIYEYVCKHCGLAFEELIRGDQQPACPACGRDDAERQMSVPAAHSSVTGLAACPAQRPVGCSGCCGQSCGLADR